jgi:hypothetical protein
MSTTLRTRPRPAASRGASNPRLSTPPPIDSSKKAPARARTAPPGPFEIALGWAFRFAFWLALTFATSSLLGHTQMEASRREMLRAKERAQLARLATAQLRRQVDRLTSMHALDQWARARGFVQTPVASFDASSRVEYVASR